jgi:hypothetical protein
MPKPFEDNSSENFMDALNAIRREKDVSLWVFNMSAKRKGRTKNSNVSFTVTHNNQTTLVTVPLTWVPINLGLQASKSALFESTNFLKSVTLKYLKPITTEKAREFFRRNQDAEEEYDRIMAKMSNVDMAEEDFDAEEAINIDSMDVKPAEGDFDPASKDVQAPIIDIIERFNSKDREISITESEAFSALKNYEDSLTKADIEYISSKSKSEKLQQFANKAKSRSSRRERA